MCYPAVRPRTQLLYHIRLNVSTKIDLLSYKTLSVPHTFPVFRRMRVKSAQVVSSAFGNPLLTT